MTELTIDARSSTDGRAWFFVDVTGSAELGEFADDYEDVERSPADPDHTRLVGRINAGRDSFQFDGEIARANFDGAWQGIELRVGDETLAPTDLPGFGGGSEPEPEPAPGPTGRGYVVGEDDAPIMQIPDARNCDRKPLHTTAPIRLWVAPDGDDGATGAGDDPLASIDEASARLPLFWYHSVKIHVQPGSYESPHGGGLIVGPHMQGFFGPTREGFEIVGMGDAPGDVELSYRQFNVNLWPNGSYQNARLRNLTLNGTVSGYRGGFGVENCPINPTRSDGVAVAGYGNDIWLENVTFGGRTRDAVHVKEGSEVILNGCSGEVGRRVVKGSHGTVREVYGNDIGSPADSWIGGMNANLPVSVIHGADER